MTSKEFEETLEAVANVMTSVHTRLVRLEDWMLKLEEEMKNENIEQDA